MASPAYDEAFDEAGRLRPAYEALRRRMRRDPLAPRRDLVERLRERPLGDDTRILPVPLALEEADYRTIQAGVAQRALALQAFFHDVVSTGGESLARGAGMTPRVLEEMLATGQTTLAFLRRLWESRGPDDIRFVYAPDLAREASGRWLVLEDNVGCVGGTADSFFVADAYARAAGLPPPAPETADLVRAIDRWRRGVADRPGERVLGVLGCEPGTGDLASPQLLENARRRKLLEPLGIDVVGDGELERLLQRDHTGPKALVNFDGAGTPLFETSFTQGRTPLLNAPGTGLLGNKALLPFVEDLVRLHAGDDPLLATPTTKLVRDGELPATPQDWVVKTAAGAGGTGVFVLSSLSPDRLEAVREILRAAGPSGAVVQRRVELSTLSTAGGGGWDAYRVELRPIAYVLGWQDVFVGDQPLGKAVSSFDWRRFNNVSLGACYLAVSVEAGAVATLGDEPATRYDREYTN